MVEEIAQYSKLYDSLLLRLPDLFDVDVASNLTIADFKSRSKREEYCQEFASKLVQKFVDYKCDLFHDFISRYDFE